MRTPLSLLLPTVLTLTACGGVNTAAVPASPIPSSDQPTSEQNTLMLQLVNEARAQGRTCGDRSFAAAGPVTWNARLAAAAGAHATDMVTRDYFAHTSPEGGDVRGRAEAAGYTSWTALGENLQGGATTPQGAMQDWLNSPSHCQALMNPEFRELGTAGVNRPGSRYGTYWVQVFGTR